MTRQEAAKVLEKQFNESCGDYRYQNKDKLDYVECLVVRALLHGNKVVINANW